jgi:hypothetical protein
VAAGRQRCAAVEDADVVEAGKASLEEAIAESVLSVHPPAEIGCELAEHPLREIQIGRAAQCLFHPIDEDRRPSIPGESLERQAVWRMTVSR